MAKTKRSRCSCERPAIGICESCRFFEADGETCHRHAPRPSGEPDAFAVFPHVEWHDWCGEHEYS